MNFDILGLGAVAVDEFIYVEAYPPPDSKVSVLRRDRQCGGLTATALVAASRLGAKCGYAGVLKPAGRKASRPAKRSTTFCINFSERSPRFFPLSL